jgi:curved DNA-binding protein CbpA
MPERMSLLDAPGDLAQTPLAAVLLEALNERATGVLSVAHGGGTSRLWFRDGRPVGAQVFTGFRPLGHLLLQAGLIDIDALSRSLALLAETRKPQGELLVEMGAVSREDVARVLADQQASYVGAIAALERGAFLFDRSVPVPEWTRGSGLAPLGTVIDALERAQAGALVASALRLAATSGARLAPSYPEEAEGFRFSPAERALVARLERPVSLEAFLATSDVSPERARAILAAMLLLGLAVPAEAGAREDPRAVVTGAATAPPAAAGAPQPAAPPRRSDPAEARARRQRLLQQAIRNMGVGPFAPRERSGAAAPAGAAPSRGAAADAPAPDPAEAQLREALLAVAPRARETNLFARLGLAPTAGREEVKKAFLGIARQFHPDRFTAPALADLGEVVKDFFTAVNEAYEVLSDDRRRAEYVQRHGSAGAEGAKVDFQKGEACLRTRDFGRARGFLESAVRGDPRPEYQAALAFAYAMDPAARDRDRARQLLAEAMKDPGCDRAFYVAGLLSRDEKDDAGAERLFRAAVQANPRNVEAIRELRGLEARRSDRRR